MTHHSVQQKNVQHCSYDIIIFVPYSAQFTVVFIFVFRPLPSSWQQLSNCNCLQTQDKKEDWETFVPCLKRWRFSAYLLFHESLWIPAIWLHHHPLCVVDSVHLQMLLMGSGVRVDNGSLLATIRRRWLGGTPFVQVSTTWALTCPETVCQRPCMLIVLHSTVMYSGKTK